MQVEDAQSAAQEAQAHARQGPAAVPAELSTGGGARASSASTREIASRELGDMGAFDMDVDGENQLVHEGREKERDNLRKFAEYERVPRHQASGKSVRVQWLDDYKEKRGRIDLCEIQTCGHADRCAELGVPPRSSG